MLEFPWRVSCLVVDFKSIGGFVFLDSSLQQNGEDEPILF